MSENLFKVKTINSKKHLNENTKINSDLVGISSSILCLIHCLALPLIYLSGTSFSVHSHLFELPFGINLDYLFAFLSLFAAYYSATHTHLKHIKYLFYFGWLVFILGILTKELNYFEYLMHLGSSILIFTHIKNLIICRKSGCKH